MSCPCDGTEGGISGSRPADLRVSLADVEQLQAGLSTMAVEVLHRETNSGVGGSKRSLATGGHVAISPAHPVR
jgi:hypothetical protein